MTRRLGRQLLAALAALMLTAIGLATPAHAQAVFPIDNEQTWFTSPYEPSWNTSIISKGRLLERSEIEARADFYASYGFTAEWFAGATIQQLTVTSDIYWSACSNNGADDICNGDEQVTSNQMIKTFKAGTQITVLKNGDGWIALLCGNFVTPTTWPAISDAKKTSFSVTDWPDRIDADTDVSVTVRMTFEANGTVAVNNATDTLYVTGPEDCTISGAGSFAVPISNGIPATVERKITINCSEPSYHTFSFANRLAGQGGVEDRDLTNNGQQLDFSRTTEVYDDADLSVSGTKLTCTDQTKVNTDYQCTASTTASNAGPYGPTKADVSLALSGPDDCTITPSSGENLVASAIAVGGSVRLERSWTVSCKNRSFHPFTAKAAVGVNHIHVEDHVAANNTDTAKDTTEVFQDTNLDVAITGLACSEREHNTTNSSCIATVKLTNAAPADPDWADDVHVLSTIAFDAADDCKVTVVDAQPTKTVLSIGEPQIITARVNISCTQAIRHSVGVTATLTNDPDLDPHAVDTDVATAQWNPADIKPNSLPSSINLRKEGLVPFALLGTADFDPRADVNFSTLRFGVTGTEDTIVRCATGGEDTNSDGYTDVVCFATTDRMGLTRSTTTMTITGLLTDGTPFYSQDTVKIIG